MVVRLLKKKKVLTPLKEFINDLKNNSKLVNGSNMVIINTLVSTLKTIHHIVDYPLVSSISC